MFIVEGTAAVLALWLILLSVRVIALRGNPLFRWFTFGGSRPETLERAIRGHGNLTEYAPIFLILLWLGASAGVEPRFLAFYAGLFCLGRFMHGLVFCFLRPNLLLRIGGMVFTLTALGALAITLLIT